MPDEQIAPRPRRRHLLLAMLAAAALFLALAGSGAFAGGDGSGDGNVVQGTPVQQEQQQDRGDGRRHDGRDCPKDRDRPSSGSETTDPPV